MSLIPWKQKHEVRDRHSDLFPLTQLRQEMDRLFDSFFSDPWSIGNGGSMQGWMPSIDLAEDEKQVTLKVEVPGIEPENIDISLSGNLLTVKGEKSEEKEDQKKDFYHVERQFGSFRRSIELPEGVDPNKLNADYKNGVLTITAPKSADTPKKRIPISTN